MRFFSVHISVSFSIVIVQVMFIQPLLKEAVMQQTLGILAFTICLLSVLQRSLSYRCRNCDADVSASTGLPTIH